MKDKLILKSGAVVELEAGASLSALQVLSSNRTSMLATWEQLTTENLKEVQIQTTEGLTVGTYSNLTLVSETSVEQLDSSILTTYCLRQKDVVELRLDALEMGQEVQDGALEDIAAVTSVIADKVGGAE